MIVCGVSPVLASTERGNGLKKIMISLYPIQNPKGNDRWLNTEDNTWYVWVGGEWVVDAWEGGE